MNSSGRLVDVDSSGYDLCTWSAKSSDLWLGLVFLNVSYQFQAKAVRSNASCCIRQVENVLSAALAAVADGFLDDFRCHQMPSEKVRRRLGSTT